MTSINRRTEVKKENEIHIIENLQVPILPKNWLIKPEKKAPSIGKSKIAIYMIKILIRERGIRTLERFYLY
jgi:hypothetical protein